MGGIMKKLLAAIFAGLFALSVTAPVVAAEKKMDKMEKKAAPEKKKMEKKATEKKAAPEKKKMEKKKGEEKKK
jgi:hypothetical protein